jgi:hypothetical protein
MNDLGMGMGVGVRVRVRVLRTNMLLRLVQLGSELQAGQ